MLSAAPAAPSTDSPPRRAVLKDEAFHLGPPGKHANEAAGACYPDAAFASVAAADDADAPTASTYLPPQPYDWADYRPVEGTPPTRWKVQL